MITLHHELEEPLKIIGEFAGLLKKGGKLLIVDWKKEETSEGPTLDIRFTEETVESQMKQGGFSAVNKHRVLLYNNLLIGKRHILVQIVRSANPLETASSRYKTTCDDRDIGTLNLLRKGVLYGNAAR